MKKHTHSPIPIQWFQWIESWTKALKRFLNQTVQEFIFLLFSIYFETNLEWWFEKLHHLVLQICFKFWTRIRKLIPRHPNIWEDLVRKFSIKLFLHEYGHMHVLCRNDSELAALKQKSQSIWKTLSMKGVKWHKWSLTWGCVIWTQNKVFSIKQRYGQKQMKLNSWSEFKLFSQLWQ